MKQFTLFEWVDLKRSGWMGLSQLGLKHLTSLTSNTAGKLDILWHDGNTLGVNGTQVGILKQSYQVGLGSFLQGQDSGTLESQITLEILSNLTNQTLEGQLADQQVS